MHPLYSIPNFITSALIISLGVLVLWKRPKEKISWLFALLCWSVAHWLLGYALVYCTKDEEKALKLARFAYVGVIFIPTFFLHFMNEFLHLRRRVLTYAAYAVTFVFLYVIQLNTFLSGVYLYFWGYYPKAGPIYWTWLIYFYGAFALCDFEFARAYFAIRRVGEVTLRGKQLKYVFWATCAASISLMDYLPKFGWPIYPCAYLAAFTWLVLMAYAIVKFRLLDVQLVVRKTLIYSLVSTVLTATYFMVMTLVAVLSSGLIGRSSLISVAAACVVVTVIILPVFRRIQALIDRLFFRFRIDREAKLMEFSSEIIQHGNTEQLTQSLCRALEEALHPKFLGFYLETAGSGDFLEVSGKAPDTWHKVWPPSNPWAEHFRANPQPLLEGPGLIAAPAVSQAVLDLMNRKNIHAAVPLISRGEVLGFLLLGEKRSEEPFANEDLILLRIIANQATVAYERPKLLQEVSSGFVHEVKMPLSKISLPAELTYLEIEQAIRDKKGADDLLPRIQRRMKFIMDQAFLASHRIDGLQQLGAPEDPDRELVAIAKVIERSLAVVDDLLKSVGVRVMLDFPADFPAILGDARQLEIVFVNLLKNAAEAMTELPVGKRRELQVAGKAEGKDIVIMVSDTGPGIPPGDQDRIFQSNYTTKGDHGTGMGLFLCRQIIQAHGGTIQADSWPSGTEFKITLPII